MSRISRIFVDQACYHIITRGNQKQPIFRDENDFLKYLSIIRRAKKKYAIRLYAYCLMSNHVHLLIDADLSRNISRFMHWLNRGYTAYFNAKYNIVGHLWQGRFISKPIVKGYYLIHCATYIETNPIKSGLATDIASYKWSSYKERCLGSDLSTLDEMKVQYSEEAAGTVLI
ncbi:MAG: transposase [Candidatus Omnitrophica bacterium]|nr:transposase [Candidatus Omnitrophota bacterium]